MEIWMILRKLRDDVRLRNFEKNFRELRQAVDIIGSDSPFIGRIVTKEKMHSGKTEKLKLNDDQLEFTVTDCDGRGKTDKNSKIYREKISWKNLKDIQVLRNAKGEPLCLDDLLNRSLSSSRKKRAR